LGNVGPDGITESVIIVSSRTDADWSTFLSLSLFPIPLFYWTASRPTLSASYKHINRLPVEYKQLEARVDALRDVHTRLLKITKVHETESVSRLLRMPLPESAYARAQYDYPVDITESVGEIGQQATSAWSSFANKNLKVGHHTGE
jgi:hypothetical protein